MPGVSVLADERGGESRLEAACGTVEHDERYRTSVLATSADGTVTIAASSYPSYPVRRVPIDVPEMSCVLDGYVYDRSEAELRELFDRLGRSLRERGGAEGEPPAWAPSRLAGIDGEFVAVFLDERNDGTTVITDPLGRLPIYVGTHDEGVCISRELRVAADAGGQGREYDRLAIAQRLCLGYPLGTRTLLEGVWKPRPAAWLTLRPGGNGKSGEGRVTAEQYHTLDLGETAHADRSRQRNARELARLFEESCRSRASVGERPILSLSGGLDSRAVLGGLVAAGVEFEAATMTGERVAAADAEVARELAALYDVPWTNVPLPPRSAEDLSRYTALRSGRLTISNADILSFFDRLRSEFGPITYLTGDGGDKLLPDPTLATSLTGRSTEADADAEEMASFLTERDARLSPSDAAAIAGLPAGTIEAATARRIRSYPESGTDAHLRFLFAERAYNILYEAEERNRCSFWSTSPFYSLPFVRYAMNVPREQKRDYRLYGDFLRALSPDGRLLSVRNPTFNACPGTARHTLTAAAYRCLQRYPAVLDHLVPIARSVFGIEERSDGSAIDRRTIREQIDTNDVIEAVLDRSAIEDALSEDRGYDRRAVLTILTVTALIDARSDAESVLEADPDRLFDRPDGAGDDRDARHDHDRHEPAPQP